MLVKGVCLLHINKSLFINRVSIAEPLMDEFSRVFQLIDNRSFLIL